jgi:hypothetical protein
LRESIDESSVWVLASNDLLTNLGLKLLIDLLEYPLEGVLRSPVFALWQGNSTKRLTSAFNTTLEDVEEVSSFRRIDWDLQEVEDSHYER